MLGNKNIHEVPLPPECELWKPTLGKVEFAVKGIKHKSYMGLNKTLVQKLPNGFQAKRRKIDKSTRGFQKDSNDKYVYEDYKIPSGSMIVLSEKDLNLSYNDYIEQKDGYGYVDFTIKQGKKIFMYVLPKEVLYAVNQTALVLSLKSSMSCYNGYGYTTWDKGAVYLYVIPYKPNRKYEASKVLKAGHILDYSKEIKMISDYWTNVHYIPDIPLSALESGDNLCLKPVTISSDIDYNPIEMIPISTKEIYGEE